MFLCTLYCICTNNSPGIFELCGTEESNGRVEGRGRVKGRGEKKTKRKGGGGEWEGGKEEEQ